MKWFANMKVRTKMIFSFMVILALLLVSAIVSIVEMQYVDDDFNLAIEHPLEARDIWQQLRSNYRDLRRLATSWAVYMGIDDAQIDTIYADAKKDNDLVLACLADYEANVNTNPRYSQADKDSRFTKADNVRTLINRYWDDTVEPLYQAARDNDRDTFVNVVGATGALANELRDDVDEMIQISVDAAAVEISAADAAAQQTLYITIILTVIAAIFTVIIALYVAGYFSNLLVPMTAFVIKAGTKGDLTLIKEERKIIEKYTGNKDELGRLTAGFVAFITRVTDIAQELETVAGGDLTSDIKPLSDADVMGNSLQKMVGSLNDMFGEINSSTAQVSTGAKQIADGSQALAQGATQQAAAVEQLSSSISEIAGKTKDNADMADRAAALANTIMGNAEKGSRQMNEMMTAVKDINTSSQQISRVIKVIDDIAFQTNILALNAAVEAARAGQHGKGFAVVAEEVRSLASKSAEAAKETGNLIANSTEKAELGSRIANDTAASLAEIVQGINESSQLVSQIAQSSDEQSAGISQINKGIDQVAQVVQQNSATAEQSAAASEEMSGQSRMLEELISQFKLKNDRGSQISRSAYGGDGRPRAALPAAAGRQIAMPEKTAHTTGGGDFGKY